MKTKVWKLKAGDKIKHGIVKEVKRQDTGYNYQLTYVKENGKEITLFNIPMQASYNVDDELPEITADDLRDYQGR